MQQIEEDGVYVSSNRSREPAMHNLDWQCNTLDTGSFNPTTAIGWLLSSFVCFVCGNTDEWLKGLPNVWLHQQIAVKSTDTIV